MNAYIIKEQKIRFSSKHLVCYILFQRQSQNFCLPGSVTDPVSYNSSVLMH